MNIENITTILTFVSVTLSSTALLLTMRIVRTRNKLVESYEKQIQALNDIIKLYEDERG